MSDNIINGVILEQFPLQCGIIWFYKKNNSHSVTSNITAVQCFTASARSCHPVGCQVILFLGTMLKVLTSPHLIIALKLKSDRLSWANFVFVVSTSV
jgi:hypothetical protein